MERRKFIKTASGAAIISQILPVSDNIRVFADSGKIKTESEMQTSFMHVRDNQVFIETLTLTATITNGFLASLKSKLSGEEFIFDFNKSNYAALQILDPGSEVVDINEYNFGKISILQTSDQRVEIRFQSWNGDGLITISTDDSTGDLIVEPSAYSSRAGVIGCRWNIPGIKSDLQIVAPLFQGVKLRLDDPLIRDSRWPWPMSWEAGLAILQSAEGGFYIHAQDTHYIYKALKIGLKNDPNVLGLDTEAYGPIDNNLSAGGLKWRINVYKGGWQIPAERYHEWLWNAYDLKKEEGKRPSWINDVKLAISWCPGDPEVLDALAKRIAPGKVLLHYPDWRTDIYDQNYPTYVASERGKSFVQKCHKMGFHIMPHFNSVDMDPSHPVYTQLRDFQYRDIVTKKIQGWSWVDGKVLGVPESNESRIHNRDKNVMVKIHPGLSTWRSILGENIHKATNDLDLDCVFIDVTLVTQNLHNCLVESITSTEGMKRLIGHIGLLGKGLVVGGEGLNEITMQGLSFAQAHLFKSWQTSTDGLERTGGCNLNQVLFGRLCKTIGYSNLSGNDKDSEMRIQINLEHGSIPTITIDSAIEISSPNTAVRRLLDMASH
jgi:hypothetical protein